jgi:uncharacterized OsmC-like protein
MRGRATIQIKRGNGWSMSNDQIREAIESAKKYLSEPPAEARYKTGPRPADRTGMRCRVEGSKDALVVTEMPAAVRGEASASTPGWLARAAQASCDARLIAMRAAELGITVQRLEVTVDSESHDRGPLGMDEQTPAGLLSSRIRVRIAATEDDPSARVSWSSGQTATRQLQMPFRRAMPTTVEVGPLQVNRRNSVVSRVIVGRVATNPAPTGLTTRANSPAAQPWVPTRTANRRDRQVPTAAHQHDRAIRVR